MATSGRAVLTEEAETHGDGVDEGAQLFLRLAEGVLHPAARGYGLLQIGDLLPQGRDLVDEVLLGTVLISHASRLGR